MLLQELAHYHKRRLLEHLRRRLPDMMRDRPALPCRVVGEAARKPMRKGGIEGAMY